MYLSDLIVYFKVEVYFRVTWSRIEGYANTTNIEFIVDPKVLFHVELIYSYLHISWSSDCQGCVQIGSLTSLRRDHVACIDDTACRGRKTEFW